MLVSSKSILALVAAVVAAISPVFAQERQKILALHGGGGTAEGFSFDPGMQALEAALPDFEFVYAQGGYAVDGDNYLWMPDPPSKDEPTTSPNVAKKSIKRLNRILDEQGPFYAIMGYSQGAAFVPVYLANTDPGTFEKAMMFCGYLTETHLGLLGLVNDESPFGDIDALIWIGLQDDLIVPDMSRALIPKFTSPTVIESQSGGHAVPGSWDSTFESVLSFVTDGDIPPTPTPPPQDDDKPDDDKPDDDKPDDDKPDDDECADDPEFFYKKKKKDCDWVGEKSSRCDIKYKKKKLSKYCPDACGFCDDDSDDDKCVDDPDFRYKDKKKKDCGWVDKDPKSRCDLTWKGKKVSDFCPETCWACDWDWDK